MRITFLCRSIFIIKEEKTAFIDVTPSSKVVSSSNSDFISFSRILCVASQSFLTIARQQLMMRYLKKDLACQIKFTF